MKLPAYSQNEHNEVLEEISTYLYNKIKKGNLHFYRLQVAFYMAQIASAMRANVKLPNGDVIPINSYVINLSPSGTGKGHSTNIIENELLADFYSEFITTAFPFSFESNLLGHAVKQAQKKGSDPDAEVELIRHEYDGLGNYTPMFDEATVPAIKQQRQKLLLNGLGSVNITIDEIGSNLTKNIEALNAFLELYDLGLIKQKLTKNTKDNSRGTVLNGRTPANMLMYGTPFKLLDAGTVENDFFSFLYTGYARRSLFGFAESLESAAENLTAEELYDQMLSASVDNALDKHAKLFESLASMMYSNKNFEVERDAMIYLLNYQKDCEQTAAEFNEYQQLETMEMQHRYFKATKLAGAFAFVSKATAVQLNHVQEAIRLVEDSAEAFGKLLNREKSYEALCKYICAQTTPVSQVDLMEGLSFYKGSRAVKEELMNLAVAWGYQNNRIIKETIVNGITFWEGESLEETNLDKLILSYSQDITTGYMNQFAPFSKLDRLTQNTGMNWVAHHTKNGHRSSENIQEGFNLLVLDVDDGASLNTVTELLKEYTYHIYTTKRHTDSEHRFRVILPMQYVLKLSSGSYSQFMQNVMDWLPFEVDPATKDIARKWLSNKGQVYTNEGKLLDPLPFIPDTSKQKKMKAKLENLGSLNRLEKWFVQSAEEGNRNHSLLKYALVLADNGYSYQDISKKVYELNSGLSSPLGMDEITNTILKTVAKRV